MTELVPHQRRDEPLPPSPLHGWPPTALVLSRPCHESRPTVRARTGGWLRIPPSTSRQIRQQPTLQFRDLTLAVVPVRLMHPGDGWMLRRIVCGRVLERMRWTGLPGRERKNECERGAVSGGTYLEDLGAVSL